MPERFRRASCARPGYRPQVTYGSGGRLETNGKRLRLLFPDIHGLDRGKYLFGDVAESGHAAFCIGVYPLTHDREILPVPNTQFDIGLPDIDVHLDRESLRPCWEADTVIGIGDATFRGAPVPLDPRHVLREAVEAWRAMGLEPQISFELEFYLLEPDGAGGGWRPVSLPGHRVYGTGTAVDPSGCVTEMVDVALASGFQIESWNSEYDESAFEVNIRYNDAIAAADEAFLFRLLIREVAARHGKLATFLGRPLNDRGGSGMHVNFSFRREDGSNAFHDPNDPEGLSTLARQCIAGVLAHHAGMSAIMAPHVNAYKRLQPGHAERLLGHVGARRPQRHRARPARPRRGHAAGAAHGRRRGEPLPGGRGRPATRRASGWRTTSRSPLSSPRARPPTPMSASRSTWRRRWTR